MNKILVSLLAGIVIGILIAPDKGSETWKRIKERAMDYKDDLEDEADNFVQKTKEKFNENMS